MWSWKSKSAKESQQWRNAHLWRWKLKIQPPTFATDFIWVATSIQAKKCVVFGDACYLNHISNKPTHNTHRDVAFWRQEMEGDPEEEEGVGKDFHDTMFYGHEALPSGKITGNPLKMMVWRLLSSFLETASFREKQFHSLISGGKDTVNCTAVVWKFQRICCGEELPPPVLWLGTNRCESQEKFQGPKMGGISLPKTNSSP